MKQSDDATTHEHTGLLVIALAVLAMMFVPMGCVHAEETEELKWEIALITWFDKVPPKKTMLYYETLNKCYEMQLYLQEEMEGLRRQHPQFGAIVGECNERE